MLDKDLLLKIVSVQSSYNDDTDINKFIIDLLSKNKSIKLSKDAFGNIYAVKGEGKSGYKCIVCHTDTVHSIKTNRKVFEHNGHLFAMSDSITKYGSPLTQTGIGGDDRCGVYTCIKALEVQDDVKAVFFRFEESGCQGSNASIISFFNDCNFVIQCDRKGNSDFITHTNGILVASDAFENAMKPLYEAKGFAKTIGVATDIGALKRRGLKVSAVNLSSGYFDPHSATETIDLKGLENCFNLVLDMFNKYGTTRFEHEYIAPVYVSQRSSWQKEPSKKKGFFSNSLAKNILSLNNANFIDIKDIVCTRFIEVGKTRKFKLINNEILYLDKLECPLCQHKGSIIYSTYDAAFYCSESKCSNEALPDLGLFKSVKILDAGIPFVYDRINDVWSTNTEATWNVNLSTYQYDLAKRIK